MKQITNKKLWFCLGILAAILLVFVRFGLYFWKIGGFSGLSILLPVLLFCAIVSGICTSAFYGAWVYRDCKKRGDDPLLWAAVVSIATPFVGLLIYFLRRPEVKKTCPACGWRIPYRANYCEKCGSQVENKEDNDMIVRQRTAVYRCRNDQHGADACVPFRFYCQCHYRKWREHGCCFQ